MRLAILLAAGVGVGSFLLPAPAFAQRDVSAAGYAETANITAAEIREAVKTLRGGLVHSITLMCTTAPCEVAIYDSTATGGSNSGSGTVKWEGRVSANNGTYTHDFAVPLATDNGIAVEVAGTGANAFIAFE